jgi:tetratricopeptide (TPR) repeat protein
MARLEPEWQEEQEREHRLSQLYMQTRRALRRGQVELAAGLAQQAVELAPDTTSVEELLGDVALAEKNFADARRHYERALEIAPENTDAERKLGQVAITLGETEHLRRRVQEAAEDPGKRRRYQKQPTLAGLLSFVFPGFGQLYNSQYEKGLGIFAAALILLFVLIDRLFFAPFVTMATEAAQGGRVSPAEQMDRTRQVLGTYGFLAWALIALGIAVYVGLWVYAIVDAYRTCQRQAREADDLGVEL